MAVRQIELVVEIGRRQRVERYGEAVECLPGTPRRRAEDVVGARSIGFQATAQQLRRASAFGRQGPLAIAAARAFAGGRGVAQQEEAPQGSLGEGRKTRNDSVMVTL